MRLSSILLPLALLAPMATAQLSLVAPNGYAATEGNSNNIYPWGRGTSSMRTQYIYDSATFTAQGVTAPVTITRLRFRAEGTAGPITSWPGATYPQVRIDMSNCPVDHHAASSTFANNHGSNVTTVLNGPVTMAAGTRTSPGPWYIDIPLTTPFTYNPLMGEDLTLDIQLDGTGFFGGTAPFDAVSGAGAVPAPPLGTRVYDDVTNTPNGTTGTVETDYAAVCEFTYAPAVGLFPAFSVSQTGGTSPLTVQFTDLTYSSDPGGATVWLWDFDGDNVIDSTLRNPTFVYNGCADFNVSLTVTDASHGQATLTRNALIRTDVLTASFTKANMGNGSYQFTDTTTPTPHSWAWDFDGDNVIDSTAQNPVWNYPLSCTPYNVTLTAGLNCRTGTATDSVFASAAAISGIPFTGGSGASSSSAIGHLFDVNVTAADGVSICALTQATWNYTGPFTAQVYVTPGTYVAKDTNIANWRLAATGSGTAAGGTSLAPYHANILLNSPLYLPAGQYGVAVYLSAAPNLMFVAYTFGTRGPFTNSDLTINPVPPSAPGIVKSTLFGAGRFTQCAWNGTLHYTKVSLTGAGGYGFFGAGCASSLGVTNLSASAAPRVGQSLVVTGNNAPSNAAIGMLGYSNTSSAFGPLPVSLTPYGAAGCFGRVSPDATLLVTGSGNTVTWSLSIPNLPGLLGMKLYQQLLVLDPALNALGAAASDAAGLVIGS